MAPATDTTTSSGGGTGTLYLVATPIGNLEDITYRAVRTLGEADLVAAEDTRRTRVLLTHYGIGTPTVSYFEGNEAQRAAELIKRMKSGANVALVSDAGTPGISDPGTRLIEQCVEAGIPIDVIPGPSAVLAALLHSALPCQPFRFIGFLPRKGRERREAIETLRTSPETTVLFEAANRLAKTLAELAQALGKDREIAIARELTKRHQEVLRGSLEALANDLVEHPRRGEVAVVVRGSQVEAIDGETVRQAAARLLARGLSPRQVADELADASGGRRRAYQLAIRLASGESDEA